MFKRLIDRYARFGYIIHQVREEERVKAATHRVTVFNEVHGGQVWKSKQDNQDYQVLFLTNLFTGGHIQVVYSKHWAYISSMPIEDFLEEFTINREVDNELATAFDDLMALSSKMREDGTLDLPKEGEYWTRVDRVLYDVTDSKEPLFKDERVQIYVKGIVYQSPSQPFVLFVDNNERRVLNMHQFLNTYKRAS